MAETTERDYILGTHDEEIERLGLQHRVWRPYALECWRKAGVTFGWKVVDLGAGPGYATFDLAEIVGPAGEILAVERSRHFLDYAQANCNLRRMAHVRFQEADVVEDDIQALNFDAVWCRWVASFVKDPRTLVRKVSGALRSGGVAMFHEYFHYASWRVAPARTILDEFTQVVVQSWRDAGGEPDIAPMLAPMLYDAGLEVVHLNPIVWAIRPDDYRWQWPKAFFRSGLHRLVDIGVVTQNWADEVTRTFDEAERDPTTLMVTPIVLEIMARKK